MSNARDKFSVAHRRLVESFSDGTRRYLFHTSRQVIQQMGFTLRKDPKDPFERCENLDGLLARLAEKSAWEPQLKGFFDALTDTARHLADLYDKASNGNKATFEVIRKITGYPSIATNDLITRSTAETIANPLEEMCKTYPYLPTAIQYFVLHANFFRKSLLPRKASLQREASLWIKKSYGCWDMNQYIAPDQARPRN